MAVQLPPQPSRIEDFFNGLIWHYDGTWTKYAATDWTYDGTYASFTATGFSGYAVTVPEPGTLVMLLAAALGFLICVWRRRNPCRA